MDSILYSILESFSIVNENYVINEKDIECNLDKWKPGVNNILYVTGLSGSGKTTLGELYEKENKNAHIFELDGIENNYDSSNMGILSKLKKEFPEYNQYIIDNGKCTDGNILYKAIKKAINIMKKDSTTLYIVEGVQIWNFCETDSDYEFYINKPLIIKGTSAVNSCKRMMKRENMKLDKSKILNLVKAYFKNEKMLSKFKNHVL